MAAKGNGISVGSLSGKPAYARFNMTFRTEAEAKEFAAQFPKSLLVRGGQLSSNKKYYPELDGEGPVTLGIATFGVKLLSVKGNEANETGIARYRKFMDTAEKLGYDIPWTPTPEYPTRESFEAALDAPASPAPTKAIPEGDGQLTETPASVPEAKSVLAPTQVTEPEQKSVPVAPSVRRIPMEFKEASVADVPKYAADDKYYFQQKVDGVRGQLVLDPGKKPWFRSKSGDQLQSSTAAKIYNPLLAKLGAGMPEGSPAVTIDGEMLDGKWYVFDMTVAGSEALPWEQRMDMAEKWVEQMRGQGLTAITALPTARTPAEKQALFEAIRDSGGEGVMIKRRDAKYKFGQRTDEILKAKITASADVVVMGRNVDGKVNAVVGVYKDGKLTRVANIPMQGKADAKVGDVVEVEYLWAHPDSGLLTQARMKKVRPDKSPSAVTDSQFRFVNKEVLDLPTPGSGDGVVEAAEVAPNAPSELVVPETKPWHSPEAKAEFSKLEAMMARIRELDKRYDDFSTGRGVARNYVKGVHDYYRNKAWNELKAARDEFEPLNEAWLAKYGPEWPDRGIGLDDHWDTLPTLKTKRVGTLDSALRQKLRDMYVVPDEQTIKHNASLRTPSPTPASKTWRSKVTRLVNNEATVEDSLVYRVGAFTPDFVDSLKPGAILTDPGFTSTGSDQGASFMYASVRTSTNAGTLPIYFHIQVPAGTPAADVDYGEVVLDYGNSMEILRVGMVDGRRTAVVRLIPKGSK